MPPTHRNFPVLPALLLLVATLLLPAGCRRPLPKGMVAWQQSLSELDACTRRKHIEASRCDMCARRALEEKENGAAQLFRALARSERIHERNCLKAIRRLGGRYSPPPPITIPVGNTGENIDAAIDVRRECLQNARRSIGRTLDENNRYAGRLLIHIAGGESHQLVLLEKCVPGDTGRSGEKTGYAVCPTCGNIYTMEYCDPYCPFCLTDGRTFLRFE